MKFIFDNKFFKRSMFSDIKEAQMPIPGNKSMKGSFSFLPNPNGSQLILETQSGFITIILTPEQSQQIQKEIGDLH